MTEYSTILMLLLKVIGMALKLEEVTAFALLFPGLKPGSVDYLSFIAYARTQLYPCTKHYVCPCPYCYVLKDCLSCHCSTFRKSPQPGICVCGHYKYAHTRHALPQDQPQIGRAPPSPRLLDPIEYAKERKQIAWKKRRLRADKHLADTIAAEFEKQALSSGARVARV